MTFVLNQIHQVQAFSHLFQIDFEHSPREMNASDFWILSLNWKKHSFTDTVQFCSLQFGKSQM